jgi:hypothetical protein
MSTHSPHTPSSQSAPTRHPLALVLSHQACAVNSQDDRGPFIITMSSDEDSVDRTSLDSSSRHTLPHLWADSGTPPTTTTTSTMQGQQANAAITSNEQQQLVNDASSSSSPSGVATYAALYAAATTPTPPTSTWRSPSSLSSNSEQDHHRDPLHRFSVASTIATSEGCHNAYHAPPSNDTASNKHNSLLAGVMEVATAQDQEIIRDEGTTLPEGAGRPPCPMESSIEAVDTRAMAQFDGFGPAEESYSPSQLAASSLQTLVPSSVSGMQDHPSVATREAVVSEVSMYSGPF